MYLIARSPKPLWLYLNGLFPPPLRLRAQSGRPPARLPPARWGGSFLLCFSPLFLLVRRSSCGRGPAWHTSPDWLKPFIGEPFRTTFLCKLESGLKAPRAFGAIHPIQNPNRKLGVVAERSVIIVRSNPTNHDCCCPTAGPSFN